MKAILGSSRSTLREHLQRVIVELVFDKVSSALESLFLAATGPIGLVISNEKILRALRILAVFICPAPSEHREVQVHALKPLEDDARGYFSDQTKQRVKEFFSDWATGAGQGGPLPESA